MTSEKVSDGVYKISAVVGNRGYLPTNLTEEANQLRVSKPVTVCVEGCEAVSGKNEENIGNLDGFSATSTGAFYGDITTYANAKAKKKASWIVKAEEGSTVTVTCKQEKAGTDTKTITL